MSTPLDQEVPCQVPGCSRPATDSRSLCNRHRRLLPRRLRGLEPSAVRVCAIPELGAPHNLFEVVYAALEADCAVRDLAEGAPS